jgi:hypothetical protein
MDGPRFQIVLDGGTGEWWIIQRGSRGGVRQVVSSDSKESLVPLCARMIAMYTAGELL